MSRYSPLIAVLATVLSVLLFWSTGVQSALFAPDGGDDPVPGVARLRIPETRQDLGAIAAGQRAQAIFRVANEGSRRLIIRRETGRCCGQSGPEDITLVPPGGTAALIVEVDSTGIRGGLQQEVVFATNDPKVAQLRLTVVARVAGELAP